MKPNKQITLNCGIPASGKSTWSTQFVKDNNNYIRVCRDDYRFMFKGVGVCDSKVEKLISTTLFNAIHSALNRNLNVIVDQTNLKAVYINEFIEEFKYKADISFKVFDITVEEAIERDSKREKMVGEDVIKRMYMDYINLINTFDFSVRIKEDKIITERFVNPTNLPKAVIFDLDGTLALSNGKRYIFDWNSVDLDDVSKTVKESLILYRKGGYDIVIMSGRDSAARTKTILWLDKHNIPYDDLFMRDFNDNRKDSIVKRELYDKFVKDKYWISLSFDDRNQATDTWRSLGIKCYQVEDGNF